MTRAECYQAYLAVVCPGPSLNSIKGSARDAGLLPLSCMSILAFDNHGYSYPVIIEDGVLWFVGAPSGWRLSSFFDGIGGGAAGFPDQIALDFGQSWFCVNFDEVLREIVASGLHQQVAA